MDYIKAFLIGGIFCLIGQILIDKTKLTPARILVSYVVAGVFLGAVLAVVLVTVLVIHNRSSKICTYGNAAFIVCPVI